MTIFSMTVWVAIEVTGGRAGLGLEQLSILIGAVLCKRKSHCTAADLLFYFFGFCYFAHVELGTDLLVWLNPKPVKQRSVIQ